MTLKVRLTDVLKFQYFPFFLRAILAICLDCDKFQLSKDLSSCAYWHQSYGLIPQWVYVEVSYRVLPTCENEDESTKLMDEANDACPKTLRPIFTTKETSKKFTRKEVSFYEGLISAVKDSSA